MSGQNTHTISFVTLGCKVNRYESDAIRQVFEERGFSVVPETQAADVCVINTCAVTAEADRKSRQMIRRAKRKNPNTVVVAMGCQIELLKSASEADISVGTKNRLNVIDMVLERLQGAPSAELQNTEGYQEFGSVLSQEDTRAYIKIEDGCDSFCSYCIIPHARGRVKSRNSQEILEEAAQLGNKGFHEIVLTGIHICSYGKDRGEGIDALGRLLIDLDKIPSIHRIRLGSLEPNSMTEDFIRDLSLLTKICPHFHISLQSGSDAVLSRMNRKYDTSEYRNILSQFHRYFSDVAVTTDIIVGFPAETDAEYKESLSFCREMGFTRIHVFPFSARQGTKAADMNPKVDAGTLSVRKNTFLQLSSELSDRYCASLVGKTVEVLLETADKNHIYSGYTKQYVKTHIDALLDMSPCTASDTSPDTAVDILEGAEVHVVVKSYKNGELYGTIASESNC